VGAAVEAARVRLRPILMTSACFIHMVAAVLRRRRRRRDAAAPLATANAGGAFGVTLFGIFLTPVFFYSVGAGSATGGRSSPRCARADATPSGTIAGCPLRPEADSATLLENTTTHEMFVSFRAAADP